MPRSARLLTGRRACFVDSPQAKIGRKIWVGYLLVDDEDGWNVSRAYWIVPVRMRCAASAHKHNDKLVDIEQLDDALEHQAEGLAYAALLSCPSRALIAASKDTDIDTHIVYTSFPSPPRSSPSPDKAGGEITRGDCCDASQHHLILVKRFAVCREQDAPNSAASKRAQLMVRLSEGEENQEEHSYPLSTIPMSADILACAAAAAVEGELWYIRNGIWVNDFEDRDSLGRLGQKITEDESELFALSALHACATTSVYPLPPSLSWASFIRNAFTPLEMDFAIKALDAILQEQRGDSATPGPRKRRRGNAKRATIKRQLVGGKATTRLDVLGQAQHPDPAESDSEVEEENT